MLEPVEGSGAHRCHALGCDVVVSVRHLMCSHHWRLVPQRYKDRLWEYYVPGQELTTLEWHAGRAPTHSYLEAAKDCIAAVARKEGRL